MTMLHEESKLILTFDTDWAPGFVVQHVIDLLNEYGLKATLFLTNAYTLENTDNMEFALHPNFMDDSTQGDTPEAVMDALFALYPQAKGIRTHRLFWHSGLLPMLERKGIEYDCSLFLPLHPHLEAVENRITRFPYFCSDNIHIERNLPFDSIAVPNLNSPGLKIFDFHPIHIYLNTAKFSDYKEAMDALDFSPSLEEEALRRFKNPKAGIGDFFKLLLKTLAQKQYRSQTLWELLQ